MPVHKRLIQNGATSQIQPTSILSRDPTINNRLTSVSTNSDSAIVECRPIDNWNQWCNKRLSELNSLVEPRKKVAPSPKANHQQFVQMLQAAKSSTFTAELRKSDALTTPLKIQFFGEKTPKIYLEASPFLSGGGVSKPQ
ncbi:hypothetical protein [Microcoleus sp. Pol11C3]|uniref:hypothetical protein n=1 Tax=Microcoleus sp. Pol11C3 TaxID=3055390 RepID=UPI002FD408C5